MADEIVAASEILQSAVDEKSAAAIEAAQQHAADAHATAQAITDAALQTELGRQIEGMRTENMTWKTSLENQISQVTSQMTEIRGRLEINSTASGGGGPTFFDPGTIGSAESSGGNAQGAGTGKRKRGRPPGGGKRTESADGEAADTVKRAPFSEDGVTAILLSIHSMLAGFTSVPELEIEPAEAAQMAKALKGVADQYDIRPSEKSLAWANLASAAAMVYGTRIFAYRARRKTEKMDTPKTNPASVLRTVN